MRSLRALIWTVLFFVGVICVVGPAAWFYTLARLPNRVESALDIESALRQSIESERQANQMSKSPKERRNVKWDRPDFTRIPQRMVALFITETGCPTYLQTPREDGWPWMKRLMLKSFNGNDMMGDGACELIFARMLAHRMGAGTTLQTIVMADRIHKFLQKDQLVAYNLDSMWFDDGLIGVEDAALDVMQKPLKDLTDAELAELQLAIPPWGLYDDIKLCTNAGQVREGRDTLLRHLSRQGLISEEMAKSAAAQPVRCMAVKR